MATHKAWRLHSYGGKDSFKLDDVPVPQPSEGEVLVAVGKVGVNPFDWKIREGYIKDQMPLPLPFVLGVDFSGTVVSNGEGATRFKPGDRVMAVSTKLRAHAEHITMKEELLGLVPAALSDELAATIPMPALTAWETLHAAGEVTPGTRVLIHGASGQVGAFAVQFAKAAGAYVIGTASGKNRAYAESVGVDEFVDYQKEKFEERVKDVDLVLDYVLVGGMDGTTGRSWGVLKKGGALVSVADPSVHAPAAVPEGYRGFFLQTKEDAPRMEIIAEQILRGEIKSKVAKVFPRSQLPEAIELSKTGGTTGRMLIDFHES